MTLLKVDPAKETFMYIYVYMAKSMGISGAIADISIYFLRNRKRKENGADLSYSRFIRDRSLSLFSSRFTSTR